MTGRVMAHIRLGIRSVFPSDQSPRYPHEETLGPCLPIAKFRGVSPQNVAEFFREISRRKPSGKSFLFFSAKKIISRKGCFAAKREKRAFFFG